MWATDAAVTAVLLIQGIAHACELLPGEQAIVFAALSHGDALVRRGAIDVLSTQRERQAAELVTMMLADEAPDVVAAAIRALGMIGCIEQLVALASATRDPAIVASALRALRHASPARALAVARPLVDSEDGAIASAAVEVAGTVGMAAGVDLLIHALEQHGDPAVARQALTQLASWVTAGDASAVGATSGALERHREASVRRSAAEILGAAKYNTADAHLRACLVREPDPLVRDAIMSALAEGGRRKKESQS